MKPPLLAILFIITANCHGEDVIYFEKRYQTHIEGVGSIETYEDPDQFYAEIAKQLGIPQLAFDAVSKKYGWKRDASKVKKAIIRRGEQRWTVLIFQCSVDKETKELLWETMTERWVEIDDDKRVLYCGEHQMSSQPAEPAAGPNGVQPVGQPWH